MSLVLARPSPASTPVLVGPLSDESADRRSGIRYRLNLMPPAAEDATPPHGLEYIHPLVAHPESLLGSPPCGATAALGQDVETVLSGAIPEALGNGDHGVPHKISPAR